MNNYILIIITDVHEEFCFDEDRTKVHIASFKALFVYVIRNSPACDVTSVSLSLSFNNNGIAVCKFIHQIYHFRDFK